MSQANYTNDPFVKAFPETLPFWEAAATGVMLLPHCIRCQKKHWHPRAHCPFCGAAELEWQKVSGQGEVHSFSIIRKPDAPYVLAYVQLNEGPMLMTNIVDCNPEQIRIGMQVKVHFRAEESGRDAPVFSPIGPAVRE